MKIGITGDTHGDLYFSQIYKAKRLGCDTLIICGDFGYIWYDDSIKQEKQLDYMDKIGIKILFVDGNHCNFNKLNSYPITEMYNGRVHKIRENIIHLMRGEVYLIDKKKFFTFGGAESIDKHLRKENKSWWKDELCNVDEVNNAVDNLFKYDNNVDYIITHTTYDKVIRNLGFYESNTDVTSHFLRNVNDIINYKHWYFGHFHKNHNIEHLNTTCVYKDIIKLK
ncbi:MAG: metallophosphoesterase [Bacilli bacterium]